MNLTNNYIPQIKGDETCTTFCTINCPCTTNVLPTTTKSGDMSSTTNSGDITSTTNSEGMTSTTNFTSVTSTTNSGSMTSTTNSISISSTTNSGSIVSTTNSGSTTLTTKYSNMTSTTNSGTITTSTACPLSSCNTLIAVDSSSDILIPYLFEKELEIIQNNISKVIPDFSRVAIASYNEKTTINSYFNTLSNSIDFSNIIGSITSKPGSRLSILLETLYNITIPENTIINTVIFISEYIPDEISNSVNISKLIKERGSLNFIILGTDIKEEYLKILEPTNVFQLDFSICDINEVNDKFKNFTSCQSCSSPSLTTTIFSESYEPCKSSITFSILGSNDIPTSAFNAQIQALMNNNIIPSSWNHYERISIMEYDDSANIKANFNYLESRENFNSILNSLQQEDSGINLANLFAALETGLIFYPNDIAENHFIFVYNITQNDIQKAFPFSQKLKNNGSLNIIVLGTNYISGLNNLTNGARILYWDYTTKNNDILLKSFINDNLVCVLAQKKFL
uniref:VWFA domain-containing protein n=1 Tax=Parastrongyloides trichosuri TaxID=131310 RepID=A0A0N4ZPD9_PARTI